MTALFLGFEPPAWFTNLKKKRKLLNHNTLEKTPSACVLRKIRVIFYDNNSKLI